MIILLFEKNIILIDDFIHYKGQNCRLSEIGHYIFINILFILKMRQLHLKPKWLWNKTKIITLQASLFRQHEMVDTMYMWINKT